MFITRGAGIDINKAPLPRIRDVIFSKKRRMMDKLAPGPAFSHARALRNNFV